MDNDRIISLLTEIKDSNQQLLDEYRRIANEGLATQKQALVSQQESIEKQRIAVDSQLRHVKLYRRVLMIAAPVVVLVIYALVRAMRFT